MKFRPIWLALPACAVISTSCEKKEAPAANTPAAPVKSADPAAPAPTPTAPKPTTPSLSAEERAAKFGIVKHLPKDIDSFFTVYNGTKIANRFKTTQIWKLIQEESGLSLDDAAAEPVPGDPAAPAPAAPEGAKPDAAKAEVAGEPSGPALLLGQEVFIATGKGGSEQVDNLVTVNRRWGYFQMRTLAKALVSAAKGGGEEDFSNTFAKLNEKIAVDILKDPQSGLASVEKLKVVPLYVGFKTAADSREQVAQQIASVVEYMGMAEEMVEPVEFERAGAKFKGYRLLGEKVAKTMGENRKDMEEVLDPETVDKLLAAIAKKNIVVVSGTIGDYVVAFVGNTPEEFQLVNDVKESVASNDAISFVDSYAGKELTGIAYGANGLLGSLGKADSGVGDMATGLRDGLAGSDGLGDTRDIESLLQLVAEREQAVAKLTTSDTMGLVSFFENGLKIETFGGVDKGAVDWKSPSRLANLGSSEDTVFFANFTTDATYDTRVKAYAETLVETAYAVTKKFADSPIATENEDFKKFQEGVKLFDGKFRTDVVTLIDALRGDLSSGLGHESALVVDLKGAVPTVPGIPQAIVDKGKFVRASLIAPVTDRSKIGNSWNKINDSTTNILKKVSEMAGDEIPMQKPMSSEKDGFTTWFFSFPFFNDDFVPSVTVSDQWFVVSSSKKQAIELATAASKSTNTNQTGFVLNVKFDPLRRFGTEWLKLVDENSKALFPDEDKLEEFTTNKPNIEKGLKAMEDFESFSTHVRREDGRVRASLHFKTR